MCLTIPDLLVAIARDVVYATAQVERSAGVIDKFTRVVSEVDG